jgi:predicted alternative tryptophan synthase beta-subunit
MVPASDYDRNWLFDAAVARVRKHADTPASLRSHAATLAQTFATPQQRTQANEILTDLFGSGQVMSPREKDFLAAVQQALGN